MITDITSVIIFILLSTWQISFYVFDKKFVLLVTKKFVYK